MKKITLTTGALIIENSKVLLIKRQGRLFPNYWSLSGGQVEEGEDVITTIKREIKEEINCMFIPKTDVNVVHYESNEQHIISLIIKGSIIGTPRPDNKEVSDIKWYTYDELQQLPLAFNYKKFFTKNKDIYATT